MDDNTFTEILISIIPSLITALISIIAIITSYKSAKYSVKQSHNNNIDSMKFAQKEKVADQIAEKSAILLTKCDPNVLNTVINEIVPRTISHEENAVIRKYLLGISDEIQTLTNIIKMLTYSIFEDEVMLSKVSDISIKLDKINEHCANMLLSLTNLYASMTPDGNIRNINIMEDKIKIEQDFSFTYREDYIQLYTSLTELIRFIRNQSIPKVYNKNKKQQ